MNDRFARNQHQGRGDDRSRQGFAPQRESRGDLWRADEDRALLSPDQQFETSANYRQPPEPYRDGRATYGGPGYAGSHTDYADSAYDRGRFDGTYAPAFPSSSTDHGYGWSRETRGGHAGRGPKDYIRSDARIHEDVCDRLSWNDEVDATDISVLVENGEVTLEGSVETRHMKRLAEDLAEEVRGVSDVHNTLRVKKPVLTELKEKLTGEAHEGHYANTGTKTGATPPVRHGV